MSDSEFQVILFYIVILFYNQNVKIMYNNLRGIRNLYGSLVIMFFCFNCYMIIKGYINNSRSRKKGFVI